MASYRLYDERLVPELGQDDWSLTSILTGAANTVTQVVGAYQQQQTLEAQTALAKQQANLVQQQTLLQRAQAAITSPTGIGISIGTLALIGVGAFLLLRRK